MEERTKQMAVFGFILAAFAVVILIFGARGC
jgi:hypothetical protein